MRVLFLNGHFYSPPRANSVLYNGGGTQGLTGNLARVLFSVLEPITPTLGPRFTIDERRTCKNRDSKVVCAVLSHVPYPYHAIAPVKKSGTRSG